ncbi:MAG TPA: SpoIIE family protein phosphatase, partial [Anaerolineales bacterium]|nr:SpoIIE family protein phosphatase [Anaerolineales bacterium]
VTSTLNIASVDLHSGTVVLTRNNPAPIFVARRGQADCLTAESKPLGTSRDVRPVISEIELETDLTIVIFTDGVTHAGKRRGQSMDVCEVIQSLIEEQDPPPQELADSLLAYAVKLDEDRPADDISVLVLKVVPRDGDDVRRMRIRLPLNS